MGVGINYIEGNYQINVCDPYLISTETSGDYRKGFCLKKTELYSAKVNHFSTEINMPFKMYSYIGDLFEFNFVEVDWQISSPSEDLKKDNLLVPNFQYRSFKFFSALVHF